MPYIARPLKISDRAAAIEVECSAMPNLRYIDEVWDLFTKQTVGHLWGIFDEHKLLAIGKLTVLYGGFGWIETLRVLEEHQGKGCGKRLYEVILEQAKQLSLTAVGMYTGYTNEQSSGLARLFGLQQTAHYKGVFCDVVPASLPPGFFRLTGEQSEKILAPHYQTMPYAVLNRTFYPMKPGMGKHFGENGWVWGDDNGQFLVIGARFQQDKALHIPFYHGDTSTMLSLAHGIAAQTQSETLRVMMPYHADLPSLFPGFAPKPYDVITMWSELA